jgi:hypothetical protein
VARKELSRDCVYNGNPGTGLRQRFQPAQGPSLLAAHRCLLPNLATLLIFCFQQYEPCHGADTEVECHAAFRQRPF